MGEVSTRFARVSRRVVVVASVFGAAFLGGVAYWRASRHVMLSYPVPEGERILTSEERAALDATPDPQLRELRQVAWSHRGSLRTLDDCRPFIDLLKKTDPSLASLDVDEAQATAFDRVQFSLAVLSGEQLAHGLDEQATQSLLTEAVRWSTHRDDMLKIEAAAAISFTLERSPGSLDQRDRTVLESLLGNEAFRAEVARRRAAVLVKTKR